MSKKISHISHTKKKKHLVKKSSKFSISPRHLLVFGVITALAFILYPPLTKFTLSSSEGPSIYETQAKDCEVYNISNCNISFEVPLDLSVTGVRLTLINGSGEPYVINSIDIFGKSLTSMAKIGSVESFPTPKNGASTMSIVTGNFTTTDFVRGMVVSVHAASPINATKLKLSFYGVKQ